MSWVEELFLRAQGSEPVAHVGKLIDAETFQSAIAQAEERMVLNGVTEDATVAVSAAPGVPFASHLLAAWLLGAQVLLLDHRLTEPIILDAMVRSGATHRALSAHSLAPTLGYSEAEIRIVPAVGRRVSDHALIQLSSGTTAAPKLVGRSADDLAMELRRYAQYPGITGEGETTVVASSLAHTWGLVGGMLYSLFSRGTFALPKSHTAVGLVDAMALEERNGGTILGVPLHAKMLGSAQDLSRVRAVITAGAPLPARDSEQLVRRGVRVGQVYGMTEIGVVSADYLGGTGGVGRLGADLDFRVADGKLYLARAQSPYVGQADETRWEAGWFDTNDLVSVNSETRALTLRGRADGLISVAGKKFHVVEIENLLRRREEIREVVVLEVDSRIEAFIELEVPTGDLHVLTADLPEYMRPSVIRAMESLPRNATGKLLRRRDLYPSTGG